MEIAQAPRRRRWLWLAAPLALAILAGGYLLLAPRDIPMPGPDATPEEVVETYAAAINARDFDTSNAIFPTAAHAPRGFFSGYERIDIKRIDKVEGNQKEHAYVTFSAEFKGGDGSLRGLETWGYTVQRNSEGRWFISDQGMG